MPAWSTPLRRPAGAAPPRGCGPGRRGGVRAPGLGIPGLPARAGLLLGLVALLAAGCARQVAPPGGEIDQIPPRVIATEPDTFQVLERFPGPAAFRFDQPMSEFAVEGELRDAVVVSPRTGEVSVSHRRRGLDVSVEGGFREGYVYSVTLLPLVQDRFQNRLEDPVELHFSTGEEFHETLLAGLVWDRLTGDEVPGARVEVRPLDREDAFPYMAVADEEGVFALRFLPPGPYRVLAYEDLTRDREAGFTDPQDSLDVELAAADTVVLTELALLFPDTVPAQLTQAEAVDSTTVELAFDDYLDPDVSLDPVRVVLRREDEEEAPEVTAILHRHEWEALRVEEEEEEVEPPEDPPPDPPVEDPPPPPEEDPDPEADPAEEPVEIPLPRQEVYVLLDRPLEPGAVYEVEVEEVTNINGLPGGGGEARFTAPEPPEEEDPPEEDDPPEEEDPPEEDVPPGGR